MRRLTLLIFICILLPFSQSYASRAITLPAEESFNTDAWTSDLVFPDTTDCGGTTTHTTTNCWSGGCAKLTPPTSLCAGGGINGGGAGIGWLTYSNTGTVNIRMVLRFNQLWAQHYTGSDTNKFIVLDTTSPCPVSNDCRVTILSFNCSGSGGARYCSFGILDAGESYIYRTAPNRGWIEDALFRVSSTEHYDEHFVIELAVDVVNHIADLYIWTQDGTYNGLQIENIGIAPSVSYSDNWYMSYYNGMGTAADYFLVDNLSVSSSYIGPPTGFVGGSVPTVTGITLTGGVRQ